jgi:hypothetical protein
VPEVIDPVFTKTSSINSGSVQCTLCARMSEQSMGARNLVGIGLSYQPV